jgi:uncharacterized membrane protein
MLQDWVGRIVIVDHRTYRASALFLYEGEGTCSWGLGVEGAFGQGFLGISVVMDTWGNTPSYIGRGYFCGLGAGFCAGASQIGFGDVGVHP